MLTKAKNFIKKSLKFKNHEKPENVTQDDIVIVVIGPTGAGKSSFINIAAAPPSDKRLKVDRSLEPCTTELAYVRCTFEDSREVVFVDTPPFPDPKGDAGLSAELQAGNNINEWIEKALGTSTKVTRILYLRDISINRNTEPLLPHYKIFRNFFGEQYSASVALVLTMCENVPPGILQERTEEFTRDWRSKIGNTKALVFSYKGTKESARDVVTGLGVI